jgi:integrase
MTFRYHSEFLFDHASRRLGHARPSVTLDIYGHLIPTMQNEVAQLIDDLVTPIELEQVAPGCTRLHQE